MRTALVAALAGLLGIGLGAWLNSLFATRKERWEFKRQLYVRLLEHLHEATALLDTWVRYPQVDRSEALEKEVEQVRRAYAAAALVLDKETSQTIDGLEEKWRGGCDFQNADAQVLQQRVQALNAAYLAVLAVARRDLRL